MTTFPETRASLVLRIGDARDAVAWEEFVRLYQPAIYRLACRRGLQPNDAEELAQEAMLAVARSVGRFVPDRQRGRFRDWLARIARNLSVNFATRRQYRPWATGDSGMRRQLESQCDRHSELSRLFELEYRRAIFQCAAAEVQQRVTKGTWQAFWLTAIDDVPIGDVAGRLGMSVGAVYIARNRVIASLRARVRQIEAAEESV